jgi:hypothetical protein
MILLIVASRHCGSSAPPSSGLLLLRAICAFSAPECISTELQNWLSWCRFGATIVFATTGSDRAKPEITQQLRWCRRRDLNS